MITHVVVFRFRDDVTETDRQLVLGELERFRSQFPTMRRWRLGSNLSGRDQHFSHAFVVEFDSSADLNAYLDSAAHEQFLREQWRPHIAERAIVSFEH